MLIRKLLAIILALQMPVSACGGCTPDFLTLNLPFWESWIGVLAIWSLIHAFFADSNGKEKRALLLLVRLLLSMLVLALVVKDVGWSRYLTVVGCVGALAYWRDKTGQVLAWITVSCLSAFGTGLVLAFGGVLLPFAALLIWYIYCLVYDQVKKDDSLTKRALTVNRLALVALGVSAFIVFQQAEGDRGYYLARVSPFTSYGRGYITNWAKSDEFNEQIVIDLLSSEEPSQVQVGARLVETRGERLEAVKPYITKALKNPDLTDDLRSDLQRLLE